MRFILLVLLCSLTGCAGNLAKLPTIPDIADASSLKQSREAVVIARFEMLNVLCLSATATLGTKDGASYSVTHRLSVSQQHNNRYHIAYVKLVPGTYHVVSYECRYTIGNQIFTQTLGQPKNGKHGTSFASFDVSAGEVVNLGLLKFSPVSKKLTNKLYLTTSAPMSNSHIKLVQANRPGLAKLMVSRPFKVQSLAERRKKLCDLLAKISKTAKKPLEPLSICKGTGT